MKMKMNFKDIELTGKNVEFLDLVEFLDDNEFEVFNAMVKTYLEALIENDSIDYSEILQECEIIQSISNKLINPFEALGLLKD